MPEQLSDVVTFLFTDIEGSTRLWEAEPVRMADALARHDRVCRSTVQVHGGHVVKMIGDGLHAAFTDPAAAVAASLALQREMVAISSACDIKIRMRCGLHAGITEARDGDYFGSVVNRAARIMSAAHGGQVLVSQAVANAGKGHFPEGVDLRYLGRVRLRDLAAPEDVWQLLHPELAETFPALRSLDATPNNLPQQLTSFIGREQAVADVLRLLTAQRLVTLTGSGGCGKTRLALQVAAEKLPSYPDGVWLVELAALSDPGLVPQALALVLGVKELPGTSLTQTLIEHLQSRHLLLVLDNAEHLLAACARLADLVLRQCSQVSLLVSSREGLGIAGEQTFRVPSLSVPDVRQDATPDRLSSFESARLFAERAQLQLPRFAIVAANAAALASICARLDGIPLAIELAAARVRSLSVEEINQRLDQRFLLLTGGSRTALPRQQTLRSLIDWSYDLLAAAEQALLRRLAVFAGGATLEQAEQVCSDDLCPADDILDLLSSLSDKSLVHVDQRDGDTRYRLLETVRQYSRDRLLESNEGPQWRDRHVAYFVQLAETAEPQLTGRDSQAWLTRLETEHDNLRAALTWSGATPERAGDGLKLGGSIYVFWQVHGHLIEGREWLAKMLAATKDTAPKAARAKALNGAAVMAWQQADYPAARALHEECLAIRRELGNTRGVAGTLNNLGNVASSMGEFADAQALYEESLAIKRTLDDRFGIANSLNNLGIVACEQGDFAAARALYQEGLALRRQIGDRTGIASSLNNLGGVAGAQGDHLTARRLYDEAMAIHQELGHRTGIASSLNLLGALTANEGDAAAARALFAQALSIWKELGDLGDIATTLEGLAGVGRSLHGPCHAARLWGAAARLREKIKAPLPPTERMAYDRQVAAARTALGNDAAFDHAWSEGGAMTLEKAIALAAQMQGN